MSIEGKPTADVLFDTDNWWVRHSTLLTCTTWTKKAWQALAPLFPPN